MVGLLIPMLLAQQGLSAVVDEVRSAHDILSYHIAVGIPAQGALIRGVTTIRYRTDAESGPLVLDFDTVFTIESVTSEVGEPVRWHMDRSGRLRVEHWGEPGDTLAVTISYRGAPEDGLVLRNNVHGRWGAFADNWPNRAHHWFPSEDHPSDKATVSFAIEVPAGWRAVANGLLQGVDTLRTGRTVWRWSTTRPTPVATMVLGAADITVARLGTASGVEHTLWTFAEDSAWAQDSAFHRAVDMVERFTDLIGPFPFEKMAHVQSSTIFGGMENSSAIFYNEAAYANRQLGEGLIAHEIAHQWYGDAVTELDWHHLWLSEGFATFLSALYFELAGEPERYATQLRGARNAYLNSQVVGRPVIDLAQTNYIALLNANSYQKGGMVLRMLRDLIGDPAFFQSLRDFYQVYRDSTALSSDFAAVVERNAGRELRWFFNQWLTQPGYPQVETSWSMEAGDLVLRARQAQPAEWGTYRIRIPVVIDAAGSLRRVTLEMNDRGPVVIRVPGVGAAPASVRFDPDETLLATFSSN